MTVRRNIPASVYRAQPRSRMPKSGPSGSGCEHLSFVHRLHSSNVVKKSDMAPKSEGRRVGKNTTSPLRAASTTLTHTP